MHVQYMCDERATHVHYMCNGRATHVYEHTLIRIWRLISQIMNSKDFFIKGTNTLNYYPLFPFQILHNLDSSLRTLGHFLLVLYLFPLPHLPIFFQNSLSSLPFFSGESDIGSAHFQVIWEWAPGALATKREEKANSSTEPFKRTSCWSNQKGHCNRVQQDCLASQIGMAGPVLNTKRKV